MRVPGERLRVLMVIARPAGTADVAYRMIARPLLERLDAVRGQVDLVVLRPPTLAALAEILREDEGGRNRLILDLLVHYTLFTCLPPRRQPGHGKPLAERPLGDIRLMRGG